MNQYLNKIYKNSFLEQEYIKYLENENIKIVSFDIFDTLFFRKCGKPENIFLELGKLEFVKNFFYDKENFKNYRVNAEKLAYKTINKEEINLKEIYDFLPINDKDRTKIIQLELKIEEKNLFLNQHIYRWIELAKTYNKKVVLTSDMYLSFKELRKIAFYKLKDISLISDFYISSDIGFRKSTGKLFEYILNKNDLNANEILHIGDNISSDINIADAIGINTVYYNYNKSFHNLLKNEKIHLKEYFIEKDYLRLLSYLSNPYKNQEKKFFYELGSCFFGFILWEFSIWLKKLVDKEDIKQLNFFMREGYTFEKIFKLLFPDISTSTVKISRESTNFLTINIEDLGEINFNKFRKFKVKDFYSIYFLEIKDKKIKSIENEYFKEIDYKQIVIDDINSRKDEIVSNLNTQRIALLKYFESLNINSKSTFIDFGGGGTVFERINNKLFRKEEKIDILFFIHNEAFNKILNSRIIPFLPYNESTIKSIEKIKRTPDFIEILLNGFNHATSKYDFKNDEFYIIEKEMAFFDEKLKDNLEAFYIGIENFIQIALNNENKISIYKKKYLVLLLERIISLPTQEEVKYLGSLKYDEGRGSSNFYSLVNDTSGNNINLKELYLEYVNAPFKSQYEYPWMEGFITSKSSNLIKEFYGIVQTQNESAIEKILLQLEERDLKEVSIYGAGEIFEALLPYLKERNIKVKKVIDSRAKIKSFNFLGFEVKSLENIMLDENDVIVIASVVFYEEIKKNICELNIVKTII